VGLAHARYWGSLTLPSITFSVKHMKLRARYDHGRSTESFPAPRKMCATDFGIETPSKRSQVAQVVDWCSGLTSRLGLWLGGGAVGSIPRSAFVFCGGENVCVHSLCMGVGVRTALLAFTQLSSVTKGFKL